MSAETGPEKRRRTLGIMAFNDCAPIVMAWEQGFFAGQGLDVAVVRESSRANIRNGEGGRAFAQNGAAAARS